MARRVWIIPKKKKPTLADKKAAETNDCPEIANGIPSALRGLVIETMLPCVYQEPETASPITPDMQEVITRLKRLEEVVRV